jgi:hypothetical protein
VAALLGLLLLAGCGSVLGDDDAAPTEPTSSGADGGDGGEVPAPTEPAEGGDDVAPVPTDPPEATTSERLAALVGAAAAEPLSFVTVVEGADTSLELTGASDPASLRFGLEFDYAAMIAVVAATDPSVGADPLLGQAGEIFGGPWRVRSADGVVFVQNTGVTGLAGGGEGQWVRLPESLASSLIGADGLGLLAYPGEVARRLAADPGLVSAADEVDGAAVERFEGSLDLGGAAAAARVWVGADGVIVRVELAVGDGSESIATRYALLDGRLERAVGAPDPAEVVDLPEGFGE